MPGDRCREIIKNLHRILDEGSPSDNLCREIQVHLEDCTGCKRQYRELETLKRLCKDFPTSGIPEEQKKRMKENLKIALQRKDPG